MADDNTCLILTILFASQFYFIYFKITDNLADMWQMWCGAVITKLEATAKKKQ